MKRLIIAATMAATLTSCGVGYYSYVDNPIARPMPITGSVNIARQPSWGPVGYNYVMYYYFPDFDFYYDVERALFYYKNYGRWVSAKALPHGRHFPTDLHRYYKVVINQHNPWNYNRQHRDRYKHYKGVYNQPNLRDAHAGGNAVHPSDPRRDTPYRGNPAPSVQPPRNNNTRPNPTVGIGGSRNDGNQHITPPKQNPSQDKAKPSQNNRRQNQGNVGSNKGKQGSQQVSGSSSNRSNSTQSGGTQRSGSQSGGSRSNGSRGR